MSVILYACLGLDCKNMRDKHGASEKIPGYTFANNSDKIIHITWPVIGYSYAYFYRLQHYIAQVRPHMEYSSTFGLEHLGINKFHLTGPKVTSEVKSEVKVRVINDPRLINKLEPLEHRRAVSSLCIVSVQWECWPSTFSTCTLRRRNIFHPYHLNGWQSTNTRYGRSSFPRTCKLWNQLPAAVMPLSYNWGFFKRRINKFL